VYAQRAVLAAARTRHDKEFSGVRAESDLQGHHSSETPGCHRCGLPLLADARFCPYCERWLDESGLQRFWARRRASGGQARAHTVAGVSERLLLSIGLVLFAAVATASIILTIVS
jgi:hypothetical protein